MHLCPRYITLCHPNSGVDNSAPSLQTVARICVPQVKRTKQAQWHSWSITFKKKNQAGTVALLVHRKQVFLTIILTKRANGTVGQVSVFQPSGPWWRCWSGLRCCFVSLIFLPTTRALRRCWSGLLFDQSGQVALLVRFLIVPTKRAEMALLVRGSGPFPPLS